MATTGAVHAPHPEDRRGPDALPGSAPAPAQHVAELPARHQPAHRRTLCKESDLTDLIDLGFEL